MLLGLSSSCFLLFFSFVRIILYLELQFFWLCRTSFIYLYNATFIYIGCLTTVSYSLPRNSVVIVFVNFRFEINISRFWYEFMLTLSYENIFQVMILDWVWVMILAVMILVNFRWCYNFGSFDFGLSFGWFWFTGRPDETGEL